MYHLQGSWQVVSLTLPWNHKDADSEVGGLLKKPEVLPVDQSLGALGHSF